MTEYAHTQCSLSVIVTEAMKGDRRCWEWRMPKPGIRHNTEAKWVRHRFPVVGGKTDIDVMAEHVSRGNALLARLLAQPPAN